MKSHLIFAVVFLFNAYLVAAEPLKIKKELSFIASEGKMSFLAKGKPSMIKIIGESAGPFGTLSLENNKLNGSLDIDLNKLTTKIELRDDHLKNKYLEISKYPKAQMTFKDITYNDKSETVPFIADLTLHGVTKPVSGTITFLKKQTEVTGAAEFKIKITDYLPDLPSYAGIKVADEVEVKVDLKTNTK